ncbi:MAG: hypothetical protein BWK78_09030 [Thiotrichaceae bacterium IS1]|nr:MAG: hypothetical protein BWK78_09030 [Thiotrichaceae bacterium IS1]
MLPLKKTLRDLERAIVEKLPLVIVSLLIFIILLILLWSRVVITVHAGEAGAFYSRFFGGTVIDKVFSEGIHIIFPWDIMTVYDVRVQTVLHEFSVLTKKGLPIHLDIAIRYHPEYEMLGLLHKEVGPDYVQKIVIPQIESVLRKGIGEHDPEDIYTNKQGVLTKIISGAIEETGRKYVTIDDVIIRSLALPPTIKDAIEDKLVEEQRHQAYAFILKREKEEAERKRIEAQGIRDYQKTISETLDEQLIKWQGVNATLELSKSENSKIIIIGAGKGGLPVILNADEQTVKKEK